METIHTGMYSDKAFTILKGAMYAISHHEGYMWKKLDGIRLERLPNNEIVFDCHNGGYRSFKHFNTELEAKIWFARNLKMVVNELKDVKWNRENEHLALNIICEKTHIPTIQDMYCVYDILIERKHLENKYSKNIIDGIKGVERDTIATELEIERRKQVETIMAAYKKPLYDANPNSYGKANDEISAKVSAFRKEVIAEYMTKYEALQKKMQDEIDAVNKTVEDVVNSQAAFMFA